MERDRHVVFGLDGLVADEQENVAPFHACDGTSLARTDFGRHNAIGTSRPEDTIDQFAPVGAHDDVGTSETDE